MKQFIYCLACLIFVVLPACDYTPRPLPPIEAHFSPKGGCTEAVVREINAAQSSVLVQAYSFTSSPIAKSLVAAHRRGVHVEVILDSRDNKKDKYSEADFLLHADIAVYLDDEHPIAHNKVMIIDGKTIITGSFNFTRQAEEHNAENLLVVRDPVLAGEYMANWRAHLDHSEKFRGRE
jgi:phosphatidylserine/phosphatidylglycerophosphate/cardiolipin synthase-like enzyme